MLNKIWFWLLVIGILYGFGKAVYRTVYDLPVPPAASQPAEQSADAGQHAAI